MVSKLLFKTGQEFRNPSLQDWFHFLKESEKWNLKQLELYQLKKLQELVLEAYSNSKYYKNKFDEFGLKPNDINSLEDLKKLPIITKNELLKFNAEIHTELPFKKVFKANTSGTSGVSLNFKREETVDSFNRASIFRGYSWYNVFPWERNGYFWGFNFSIAGTLKTKLLDILQNRFRVFGYENRDIFKFNRRLKSATYLHGYSSMIYETAKLINSNNLRKPSNLKMVKGTSEKIYESYQEEIKKAYGIKMISEYGAAETGIIAFECPYGNMHINMEGVIVEEVNNEIIVTNLQMKSFPIIRYQLGDYIKLAPVEKKCQCGMHHKIIEEITGRVGHSVYGNKNIYPSLYFYYIFKNLSLKYSLYLTYQVIQSVKGELLFLIEQKLNSNNLELLKNEIGVYFRDDIEFKIEYSQTLKSNNKKIKSFISTIE